MKPQVRMFLRNSSSMPAKRGSLRARRRASRYTVAKARMYIIPYHWTRNPPTWKMTGSIRSGRCCHQYAKPPIGAKHRKIPTLGSVQVTRESIAQAFRAVQDRICDFVSAENGAVFREDAWEYGAGGAGGAGGGSAGQGGGGRTRTWDDSGLLLE